MFGRRWCSRISVVLVFTLLGVSFGFAEEGAGLFSRIKEKIAAKTAQVQDKAWVTMKLGGKAIGYVLGKAGGLIGLGLGAVIGLTLGGPVAAGIGGAIGFRIADIVVKTFGKAFGEEAVENKLETGTFDFRDAFKSLDMKALTWESAAAVAGDFLGEALGIAAGVALLGGGSIMLPIVGAITGAWLGKKIGRSIGRYVFRKAAQFGYAATQPNSPVTASGTATLAKPAVPVVVPASSPVSVAPASSTFDPVAQAKARYEKAYQAYVAATADPRLPTSERDRILQEYRTCQEALAAAQTSQTKPR